MRYTPPAVGALALLGLLSPASALEAGPPRPSVSSVRSAPVVVDRERSTLRVLDGLAVVIEDETAFGSRSRADGLRAAVLTDRRSSTPALLEILAGSVDSRDQSASGLAVNVPQVDGLGLSLATAANRDQSGLAVNLSTDSDRARGRSLLNLELVTDDRFDRRFDDGGLRRQNSLLGDSFSLRLDLLDSITDTGSGDDGCGLVNLGAINDRCGLLNLGGDNGGLLGLGGDGNGLLNLGNRGGLITADSDVNNDGRIADGERVGDDSGSSRGLLNLGGNSNGGGLLGVGGTSNNGGGLLNLGGNSNGGGLLGLGGNSNNGGGLLNLGGNSNGGGLLGLGGNSSNVDGDGDEFCGGGLLNLGGGGLLGLGGSSGSNCRNGLLGLGGNSRNGLLGLGGNSGNGLLGLGGNSSNGGLLGLGDR
ncbi:MAG: hypothetical protein ACT4OS_07200 [Acidimicrobiales bacterium]